MHMPALVPALANKIDSLSTQVEHIAPPRQEHLHVLVTEIRSRRSLDVPVWLNFICTHNSRRSQLCQVWAAVAAAVCGVPHVRTYSGGTEATAFNPRAVAAVRRAGFQLQVDSGSGNGENPLYLVQFSQQAAPVRCFSKVYDAPENPRQDFIAVMTCGEADENCPVIFGAKRIALLYDDPKIADDTSEESAKYDERSDQIAAELLWVFREVSRA